MEKITFAVIGGDTRQQRLFGLLAESGAQVRAFALDRCTLAGGRTCAGSMKEACAGADCVILPMPVSREPHMLNAPLAKEGYAIDDVLPQIDSGTLVLAGGVSDELRRLALSCDLRVVDYLARDDLAILNAVPTAEGAVQIAMEELPITLHGSELLVIGYGRVGKALSKRLLALGAHVWVSARKAADCAAIRSNGCHALQTGAMEQELGRFDAVFNTVPHMVLGRMQLRRLRQDALVIDLASKPGGCDFDAARELGIKVNWALSLPGKVAPLSAAKIIRDTVSNILEEEGIE